MRVDEGQAVACLHIMAGHVLYERRFAGPGHAHDVHVAAAVLVLDPKALADIAIVGHRERRDWVVVIWWALHWLIVPRTSWAFEAGASCFISHICPSCATG